MFCKFYTLPTWQIHVQSEQWKNQINLLNVFKVKTKYNMTLFWCFYCCVWPKSLHQYSDFTCNFEQVFVSRVWKTSHNVLKTQKVTYLFCNKSCKSYLIQQFIIALNWNKLWTNDHTMNILQGCGKIFHVGEEGTK